MIHFILSLRGSPVEGTVSWNWELGNFLGFYYGYSGYGVNNTYNNRDIEVNKKVDKNQICHINKLDYWCNKSF